MGAGSIIPANCQDWAVINKMFAESFREDIFFPLMQRKLDLARKASLMSKSLPVLFAGKAYVSWADTEANGFILINKTGEKQMHLNYMAVLPEYRRQGLGLELAGFALNLARENGADISLETQIDSPAMRLYTRLGFSTENKIHIYRLTVPSKVSSESGTMSGLTVVQAAKGLRQRLKESVLGIKTFDLVYKPKAEHSLVFHVCQPTAGREGIIHCSVKNIPHESLLQALPMLAPQVNKNSGAYLVVTGTDQISIESPWVGERIDYVRMTKLYKA